MNDDKRLTPEEVVAAAHMLASAGVAMDDFSRAMKQLAVTFANSNKVISAMYDRLHTDECTCSVHSVMKRPPPKLI